MKTHHNLRSCVDITKLINHKGDIQANPVVVEGVIYTPIAGGYIVAIDGKSGKLLWKSKKFCEFSSKKRPLAISQR